MPEETQKCMLNKFHYNWHKQACVELPLVENLQPVERDFQTVNSYKMHSKNGFFWNLIMVINENCVKHYAFTIIDRSLVGIGGQVRGSTAMNQDAAVTWFK